MTSIAIPIERPSRRATVRRHSVRTRAHVRAKTRPRGRAAALLVIIVLLVIATSVGALHEQITALINGAQPFVMRHAVLGAGIFLGLAALSSTLVFVSSVLLVPLGVVVWGNPTTVALLWVGWWLGGMLAYLIAARFGRRAVRRLLSREKIRRYEKRVPRDAPFTSALLVQLTVPSDIGGYFFGLLAYPIEKYMLALAIAEIPYAVGTVYLSSAFVERNTLMLGVAAAVALGVAIWEWRRVTSKRTAKAKPAAA